MFNKKILFKKFLITLIVLTLMYTPLIANATDVIIVDPTPDTVPPVLTSLSISSNQASPENSVKIAAEVNDELSGVNRVYISYRKPNGNSKGTYLYLNQTTKKYEGTISISTYDVAGEWVPSYLTLTDNKDNSGYVYDDNSDSSGQKFDLDPYKFTVSGVSSPPTTPESTDKVPPVLNSITISSSQVSGPGTVKLVADVSDDDTGVNSVSASYVKPSGRSYSLSLYFNSSLGKYEGSITIGQYDEIGDWQLNYVRLGDKAGNYKYIYDSTLNPNISEKQDLSNCKIHVEGITPDLIAPSLDDLGITLVQNTNNTALIKLFAEVNDYLSGVNTNSVYAVYVKPSGKSITVRFNRNVTTGKYEASIPIDKYDELGTWKLRYISVEDNKGNYRTINDKLGIKSLNAWDFSPYYFTVRGVITIPPAVPSSIGLSTKAIVMEPGETHQLKVTLKWSDNTSEDITSVSTGTKYTSSRPEDVSVDANGQIIISTNAKPGIVTIQASNSGLSEQCEITIPGAEKESNIIINPISVSLSSGQTKQLNVVAKLGDGTTNDVTNDPKTTYTSSNTSLVNVTKEGLISIPADAKPGSAKISINYNGLTAETMVTFTGPPTIKSISMTPAIVDINYGEKVQLSLRATMSDGSTKDITMGDTGTVYTTSDSTIATVDSNGLISASVDSSTSGRVIIIATYNGLKAQCIVNVKGLEIKSLDITPGKNITLNRKDIQQLSVKAIMSDNTTRDITTKSEGTTYTSTNTLRATVDENGKVTILSDAPYGTVSVYVKNGNYQEAVIITIEEDPSTILKDITVSPAGETVNSGDTLTIKVTGTYGDGSTKDLTAGSEGTTYTSTSTLRATVDANGKVTIPSNAPLGTVNIYVKNGSYQKTVALTIEEGTDGDPTGLTVSPASETVNPGDTLTLKVTGMYGDGSTKDLTAGSEGTTYTSTNTLRATVDANGKVTIPSNASLGTVNIYVKNGSYQKTVTLTIAEDTSNVLTSLSASAASTTVHRGDSFNLTVTGTYGDGSTKDLAAGSEGTTYTSTSTLRATVDANGKVTIPNSAPNGTVYIYVKNGTYQKRVTLTIE